MLDQHTINLLERLVIALEKQEDALASIDRTLTNISNILEERG